MDRARVTLIAISAKAETLPNAKSVGAASRGRCNVHGASMALTGAAAIVLVRGNNAC